MKILSIQQPFAWLIANGHKDIENRDWSTNYRGLVLIHAPKKLDTGILSYMSRQWTQQTMPDAWKAVWPLLPENSDFELGGIVGYATLQKVVTVSNSPWFHGKYGFVMSNAKPLPFIPCRGQLGLFEAPAEIVAQIKEGLARK